MFALVFEMIKNMEITFLWIQQCKAVVFMFLVTDPLTNLTEAIETLPRNIYINMTLFAVSIMYFNYCNLIV